MPQSKTIHIKIIGPVLLERSTRAKRMNIKVKPFSGVRVAVPKGVSFKIAEQFAHSKAEWMNIHVTRMREIENSYIAASSNKVAIDKESASKILVTKLTEVADKHGYSFNRVSIRNQKTRWGSCSCTNNISLNIKLILLPDELRDFILLHELVHTRVKNHGVKFWAEILKAEPRARELAKKINQQHISLL